MDSQAFDTVRTLHYALKRQDIKMGFCEDKGHFREVLKGSRLSTREGFNVYRSVAATVRQLKGVKADKKSDA